MARIRKAWRQVTVDWSRAGCARRRRPLLMIFKQGRREDLSGPSYADNAADPSLRTYRYPAPRVPKRSDSGRYRHEGKIFRYITVTRRGVHSSYTPRGPVPCGPAGRPGPDACAAGAAMSRLRHESRRTASDIINCAAGGGRPEPLTTGFPRSEACQGPHRRANARRGRGRRRGGPGACLGRRCHRRSGIVRA